MFYIISFVFFNALIFLFGRGFYYFLSSLINTDNLNKHYIFKLPRYYFYIFFGLFYIGNLTFLFNFFVKTNSIIFKLILSSILLFNFKKKIKIEIKKITIFNFIITPSLLSVSSVKIGLAFDAGLYHLGVQNWIRESVMPIGFYNLNSRYGFSSIIDFINANFWLENNYLLLHYVNLTFISGLLAILTFYIIEGENKLLSTASFFLIIFGVLDNFGYAGGRNGFFDIEAVTKQDTPFAVMYVLSNIFLIHSLTKKKITNEEVLYLSIFVLFSIQLRVFGIALLIFYFWVLYATNYKIFKKIQYISLPALIGAIWIIKNVIISSCIFYPISITCFDSLKWSMFNSSEEMTKEIKDLHVAYSLNDSFFVWLIEWFDKQINASTLKNFIISIMVLSIFSFIFLKKASFKENKGTYLAFMTYMSISIFIWIVSAPGIRLGIGIFTSLVITFSFFIELTSNYKFLNNKTIIYGIIFICIALLPRSDNYKNLLQNPFLINDLNLPKVEYINKKGFGVLPKEGSQCWVNLECIQNEDIVLQNNFFIYKMFSTTLN